MSKVFSRDPWHRLTVVPFFYTNTKNQTLVQSAVLLSKLLEDLLDLVLKGKELYEAVEEVREEECIPCRRHKIEHYMSTPLQGV